MALPEHNFLPHELCEEAYNIQVVEINNSYQLILPATLKHAQPAITPTGTGKELESILSGITQNPAKRIRTTFTSEQIAVLEREFERGMFLKRPRRIAIAQRLSLSEKNVKIWFQNRRTKHKQDAKEHQESSTVTTAQTNTKQNIHNEIVQRLMSYSLDPIIRKTHDLLHKQSHSATIAHTVANTNQNPSSTPDLNEFLELLGEIDNQKSSSDFSSSCAAYSAYTLGNKSQRWDAVSNESITYKSLQWTPK